MDISSVSGVASLAINATTAQTNDAVDMKVLNEALDNQVASAAALIESITESPQPENAGQNFNGYA